MLRRCGPPTNGHVHARLGQHPGGRELADGQPVRAGQLGQPVHDGQVCGAASRPERAGPGSQFVAVETCVRGELAGQQPTAERAVGEHADVVFLV